LHEAFSHFWSIVQAALVEQALKIFDIFVVPTRLGMTYQTERFHQAAILTKIPP
jgi:hypothetical protein